MKGLLGRAKHVHIESHTTFGDGGGGVFDVKPVGAYVENNGTVLVNGTAAGVRRGAELGPVYVRWFGAQLTGTLAGGGADDTVPFHAAIEYANGLAAGKLTSGLDADGDHAFAPTGRVCRPVLVDGPLRKTATTTLRYRGIQVLGNNIANDVYTSNSSAIIEDHDGAGFVLHTGTVSVLNAPSLAIVGCDVSRATAHRAAASYGIEFAGYNWAMGLCVRRSRIQGHKSGLGVDPGYFSYSTDPAIARVVLGDGSYFEDNREYGIDLVIAGKPVLCDLSSVRDVSCWHNGLGGIRMGIRGGIIEGVDLEGQPPGNLIRAVQSKIGQFYVEACPPIDSPAVTIVDSFDVDVTPTTSTTTARTSNYRVTGGDNVRVLDQFPVSVDGATNTQANKGIYAITAFPVVPTDTLSVAHILENCWYISRVNELPSNLFFDSIVIHDVAKHTSTAVFNGVTLPAATAGTVGTPAASVKIGPYAFTPDEHWRILSCAIRYDHIPPTCKHKIRVVLNEGITGEVILDEAVFTNDSTRADATWPRVNAGYTVQASVGFYASAESTVTVYVYPYSDGDVTTDYGASVSGVYLCKVNSSDWSKQTLPLVHVPTLLAPLSVELLRVLSLPVAGATVCAPLASSLANYGSAGGVFTAVGAPEPDPDGMVLNGTSQYAYLDPGASTDSTIIYRATIPTEQAGYPLVCSECSSTDQNRGNGVERSTSVWGITNTYYSETLSAVLSDGLSHVFSVTRSGTTYTVRVDGIQVYTGTHTYLLDGRLMLGKYYGLANGAGLRPGTVGNIAQYASALGRDDLMRVEAWAAQ
jgi:hypothetical protein